MKRLVVILMALLLSASILAMTEQSASARDECKQEYWAGTWDTYSHSTHYGTVHFSQATGSNVVTGTYAFSGGGTITGKASGNACFVLKAWWKDKSGQGDLKVTISPGDTGRFSGWSRNCRTRATCLVSTKYEWHGFRY